MTPPASTASGANRTVGEILLGHGDITEGQLADAVDRQQATGQPLGQVLVESGAITRLELASALAEQWSDAPAVVRMPPGSRSGMSGVPSFPDLISFDSSQAAHSELGVDELRGYSRVLSARLEALEMRLGVVGEQQERIAELRQMVGGLADWAAGPEVRLAELETKLANLAGGESLGEVTDRLEALEGSSDALKERLEQVINGVERGLTALEGGGAELTDMVNELTKRVDGLPAHDDVAELRVLVDEVVSRPAPDAASTQQLEAVAARLADVEAMSGSLASAGELTELRAAVEALAEAPSLQPSALDPFAERLETLEATLDALGSRVETTATSGDLDVLATQLEELWGVLSEVSARPAGDPQAASRLDELEARPLGDPEGREQLSSLVQHVAELTSQLEIIAVAAGGKADLDVVQEVRAALEEIAARPVADLKLAARVDELLARPVVDADVREQASALADRVAELTARLDGVAVSADGKVDVSVVTELRAALEEVSARPSTDPALSERVDQLEARPSLDPVVEVRFDALAERVAELTNRLDGVAVSADGKVDVGVVTELRSALEEISSRPATDPGLAEQLSTLEAAHAALEQRAFALVTTEDLADVRNSLESLAAAALPDQGTVEKLAERLTGIESRIEALAHQAVESPGRDLELGTRVESLADRVAVLSDRLEGMAAPVDATNDAVAIEELRTALAEVAARPAGDLDVAARVEALERAAPDVGTTGLAEGVIVELAGRVEELSARLDVVTFGGAPARAVSVGDESGDVDKLRVSVDSLWMRMTEFQKAVSALLDPRGISGKVSQLEARLDSMQAGVAQGSAGGGGSFADLREIAKRIEEMEGSASEARDTLLTRLEKIASSIDWRLQRLESSGEALP